MHQKPYLELNFEADRDFYGSFEAVPNFGDGDQIEFLHPVFEFLKAQTESKTDLKLEVSSARIIYNLDDIMGCEWHLDGENEFDTNTDFTLLLYCDDMTVENGGLLEFKNEVIIPRNGLGILIDNKHTDSLHRATPMKNKIPRKLFKITFRKSI